MSNEDEMLKRSSPCIADVRLHHYTLDVIRILPASISAEGLHQGGLTLILTFSFDRKLAHKKFVDFILSIGIN